MKSMHLHVSVPDLAQSIQFYETSFGAPPSVVKDDYAKWMLEDPRVNFAISQRGVRAGVDHIGIQAESRAELGEIADRLEAAGARTFNEEATTCCYARSDKSWVTDPAGIHWENVLHLRRGHRVRRGPRRGGHERVGRQSWLRRCAQGRRRFLLLTRWNPNPPSSPFPRWAHPGRLEVFRLLVRAGPEAWRPARSPAPPAAWPTRSRPT